MRVNNIVGALLPVEELAALAKNKVPSLIFHTDAVQAFGKVDLPQAPSPIDLISISGHKIEGPKGVGALIVLNPEILKKGALRPHIWGGEQEGGFRSGTQNAGLIAGLRVASELALKKKSAYWTHAKELQAELKKALEEQGLHHSDLNQNQVHWNSPPDAVPYIVNLSVPGHSPGPLVQFLEERGFLVSTGSACSSDKQTPDSVLKAMGLPSAIVNSAIRVSLSDSLNKDDIRSFVGALKESLTLMSRLMGGKAVR
jgi:cysteine desulfurase